MKYIVESKYYWDNMEWFIERGIMLSQYDKTEQFRIDGKKSFLWLMRKMDM